MEPDDRSQRELRASLAQRLNGCFPSHDSPRGLVATVSSFDFQGGALEGRAAANVSRLAGLLSGQTGWTVEVEGHSDSATPEAERLAELRAEAVRAELIRAGVPAQAVAVRALGNTRPIGPNNSAQGREANRRVEIVISGAPIGSVASWDRKYSLLPKN